MDRCKTCVWGTRVSENKIFCMFPECVIKDKTEPEAEQTECATEPADVENTAGITAESTQEKDSSFTCDSNV